MSRYKNSSEGLNLSLTYLFSHAHDTTYFVIFALHFDTMFFQRTRPDMTGRVVNRKQFIAPRPERVASYTHVPFSNLSERADLISLEEAQNMPHLKYHSVSALGDRPEGYDFTLVPLSIASTRDDIKHRKEGFEMRMGKLFF